MKHKLLRIIPFLLLGGVLGLAAAPAAFEAAGVKAEDSNIITCSNFKDGGTSGSGSSVSYSYSPITISSDGGYSTSGILRVYKGKKITINSSSYEISKIDFEFSSTYTGDLDSSITFETPKSSWSTTLGSQARFKSITVTLSTADVVLSSLSVDTSNAKTSFVKGQTLDLTGLKVDGNKVGGGTVNVTSQCSFSPAAGTKLDTVGSTTVNVTYAGTNTPATETGEDLTASYNVTVTEGEKENVYTKADSIADGDKIIIVNSGKSRAATVISDSCLATNEITVADDTAKFKDSDGITVFTVVENDDDTYSFKNSADKYLGVTGTKDDPKVVTFGSDISSKTSWTMVGTSLMNCCSDSSSHTKKYLQYNPSTNDFRMYNKTMTDVEFYKYSSGAEKILVQSTASVLEEASLTISSTAQGFTPSSYLWSVSDSETLQIVGDNNKSSVTVKGLKPGSANLTIKANDNDDLTATCVVTVIAKKDAVIENGNYFISDYSGSHVLNTNLEDVVGPDYGDTSLMWSIQNNGIDGDTYTISSGTNYLYHSGEGTASSLGVTTDSSHYWFAEKIEDGVYYLADSISENKLSCNPGTNKTWYAYSNPTGNQPKIKLLKAGNLIDFTVTGPTKKTYYVGEKLSITNLKVIANFDNDAHPDVTSKVVWDDLVAGTQATGTYMCGGEPYKVVVDGLSIRGPVEGSMVVEGLKDTYLVGEIPSKTIQSVTVTYSDGSNTEQKELTTKEYKVTPDKISATTDKVVVEMILDSNVRVEQDITVEHAKYYATPVIEIGDKVTLGTTVGAKDGNITGGSEFALVDGKPGSVEFGYLPTPEMEFEVVQGVSAGSFAFKYGNSYLTSNGKTLDFGHVSNITGYKNDKDTWSFDYPVMLPGQDEPLYVTLNENEYVPGDFAGSVDSYEKNAWVDADALMDDNEIVIILDVYFPRTSLDPTHTELLLDCEVSGGSLIIYLPSESGVNTKNSFSCTYVESQNDWADDYWEICPLDNPSLHVYFNEDSAKFGVGTNVDYNAMLYRDMSKDFKNNLKSISVSVPESVPTTVALGGTFNWVGIKVKAVIGNKTISLPLGAYEVDVPALDSYGEKTCTVTYGVDSYKKTATFKIHVVGNYQPFIKQDFVELWVDDTYTFTTTQEPPEGQPVTWSSSDPTVASFADPLVGDLKVHKSGKVKVTVTSYDGYYSNTKEFTVSQRPTGLTLDITEKTIKQGEKFTITGTVSPADAKNKTVLWSSSDPEIATVSSQGEVTGLGIGDVVITGQTQGKGTGEEEGYKATCTVHVEQGEVVRVTGVSLDCDYKELKPGDTFQLNAIVNPSNATNTNVTWESNAPQLADVNNNGKVTVKASASTGKTVYITCKTEDGGFTARCEIKIKPSVTPIPVSSISLDITSKKIDVNDTFEIVATVLPNNADDKHIEWSSSDESVAQIISVGPSAVTVKGVADGTALIEASCGGETATCKVTVGNEPTHPVTGVSLDKTELSLNLNNVESLVATVNPSNADNKAVYWSSSNDNVAKVDSNGKVTALSVGTAVITVTTDDGEFTATCTVTVKNTITVGCAGSLIAASEIVSALAIASVSLVIVKKKHK